MSEDWNPVETMPKGIWCETRREGEDGTNESMWVETGVEDEPREYWDRAGYSTVINPGTFAPPTHWRPISWKGHPVLR